MGIITLTHTNIIWAKIHANQVHRETPHLEFVLFQLLFFFLVACLKEIDRCVLLYTNIFYTVYMLNGDIGYT